MSPIRLALLGTLCLGLSACSDDDESPLRSKTDDLVGTWYLAATEGDSDVAALVDMSYTFEAGGDVRQRIGGEVLRALREREEVQNALAGEDLGNVDRIDGANLNWIGTWSLSGDSLHVEFDLLIVEVFGDVPILGKLTLPIFEQSLVPAARTRIDYICEMEDESLTLRGSAAAIGVAQGGASQDITTQVDGVTGQVTQAAIDLLSAQLQGLDTQRYVRR